MKRLLILFTLILLTLSTSLLSADQEMKDFVQKNSNLLLKDTGYYNNQIPVNLNKIKDGEIRNLAGQALAIWNKTLKKAKVNVRFYKSSGSKNSIYDHVPSGVLRKNIEEGLKREFDPDNPKTIGQHLSLDYRGGSNPKFYGKSYKFAIILNGIVLKRKSKNKILNTIIHELGHALCLQHCRWAEWQEGYKSIMSDKNITKPQALDVERVRWAYN